jgi:hypothetical protein
MDTAAATSWKGQVYEDASVRPEDRPRYLLILGDADGISWELQWQLATEAFVGRLAFPAERGYQAYADKVLRWERAPRAAGRADRARAVFLSVLDGSRATTLGHAGLMVPTIELARERQARGIFPVIEIVPLQADGSPDALLEQARRPGPAVLFSMSHGLGAPRFGWDSPADQRARQGALYLGGGRALAATDLGGGPFLPGGAWLFFACYGAGTPARSAYHRWLVALQKAGELGNDADAVLTGLPQPGDRPFVAALPQAVLENPDGPLAVIGHVDLAWSYSFQGTEPRAVTRADRFQGVLRALADGLRAGVASFELLRFFGDADSHLATLYGEEDGPGDDARIALKANLWMLRNDLRGYVLLGDPAARLAITPGAAVTMGKPVETGARAAIDAGARDTKTREKAVLEVIRGTGTPGVVAKRYAYDKDELQRWVDAYQDAGRAALEKMP